MNLLAERIVGSQECLKGVVLIYHWSLYGWSPENFIMNGLGDMAIALSYINR